MATQSYTVDADLLATALQSINKDWRDAQHKSVGLLSHLAKIHGEGKPMESGSPRLLRPIAMNQHSSPTEKIHGYESANVSFAGVMVSAEFDWFTTEYPVGIAELEKWKNGGAGKVIDLAETRLGVVQNRAKRDWVKQILAGGVTAWTQCGTLNGVDHAGGYLEEDAVGSQGNTVGGLSKVTYSDRVHWQNQIFDGAASFSANGLNALDDVLVETKDLTNNDVGQDARIWVASLAGAKNMKRSIRPYEQYGDGSADAGIAPVKYGGVPMIATSFMPTTGNDGGSGTTATDPISAYLLNCADIFYLWGDNGYFQLGDFKPIDGAHTVDVAILRVRGQLIADGLGGSAVCFDLETF